MPDHRRCRGDAAFTLPEVLITVAMLGIIMTAIAGALLVTIGPDQQAADRLTASHDGQLLAIYLPEDLQSATPTLADTDPGAALPCATTAPGTNLLRLEWTQTQPSPPTTYEVSYRIVNEAGEWRIVRFSCIKGGALERVVVTHDLVAGTSATVDVDGSLVTMTVTVGNPDDPHTFTVTGSRRTPDDECRVTNVALRYATVAQDKTGKKLSEDVIVTADLSGACASVVVAAVVTPSNSQKTLPLNGSGTQRTYTIGYGDYTWSIGAHSFKVVRLDGEPIQGPEAVLTVTEYVEPCVATPTATPSSVTLTSANRIDKPVTVTMSTTTPCAGLELELVFKPTAAGADRVIKLGTGPSYSTTIPADDGYPWEAGVVSLRVRAVATAIEVGSTTLTVKPEPCVVQGTDIVASPNPVSRTGSNPNQTSTLKTNVTVKVKSTGPCSGLQLKYTPTNNQSTQTVSLTEGSPGVWSLPAPIPGQGTNGALPWSGGNHTLTVLIPGSATTPTATLVVT